MWWETGQGWNQLQRKRRSASEEKFIRTAGGGGKKNHPRKEEGALGRRRMGAEKLRKKKDAEEKSITQRKKTPGKEMTKRTKIIGPKSHPIQESYHTARKGGRSGSNLEHQPVRDVPGETSELRVN